MTCTPLCAQTVSELTQCLHAFVSHLDERRYAQLLQMFLPEGRWLRQGRWLEGREAIGAALQARPPAMRVRHLITNVLVQPGEGDDLRLEAYMTAYRQVGPQAAPALYRLNLVGCVYRRHEGVWRLAEQQLLPEFEFPEPAAQGSP